MDKKIILTGATGLIGKEILPYLLKRGFEIYAFTIDKQPCLPGITRIPANLFNHDYISKAIKEIRPTHLLNLAWATTGDYLSSPTNYSFLSAGINLLQAFANSGGQRAVFAGTCFEYKFKDTPIAESDELDYEKFTYTFCKHSLHQIARRIAKESGISFGYGRIFFVFGRNEDKRRLAGSLYDKLTRNERITITSGNLIRDYMYAKDIAAAFAAFCDSNVEGVVNIGTGSGVSIQDFATQFATRLGKLHLVDFKTQLGNQPKTIVANNSRLITEVNYRPTFTLDAAISDLISSNGNAIAN